MTIQNMKERNSLIRRLIKENNIEAAKQLVALQDATLMLAGEKPEVADVAAELQGLKKALSDYEK